MCNGFFVESSYGGSKRLAAPSTVKSETFMTSLKTTRTKSQALKALGLTENAGPDEIRSAFKRLAMTKHPDRSGGSNEEFLRIHDAYMFLKAENALKGLGRARPQTSANTSNAKPPRSKTSSSRPKARSRPDPMDSRDTLGNLCSEFFSKAKEKYAFEYRECRKRLDKVV